jgi:signal peptidase I
MYFYILYFLKYFILFSIIHFLGTWRLYQKAGEKIWKAAIPLYNIIVILKKIKKSYFLIFFFLIPNTVITMYLILWMNIMRHFKKCTAKDVFFLFSTVGGYIFYMNYFINVRFVEKIENKKYIIYDLIFALTFTSFLHTYIIQPFFIPTSSMEYTFLVGDFLFGSKIHYGLRLPITPFDLPFFYDTIFSSYFKSYLNNIKFPYIRFFPLTPIKRNDIVLFNYPYYDLPYMEQKDNYIKRCVGLPGDTIQIINGNVLINKKIEKLKEKKKMKYSYIIKIVGSPLDIKYLIDKICIKDIFSLNPRLKYNFKKNEHYYNMFLSEEDIFFLKSTYKNILIKKNILRKGKREDQIFGKYFFWNRDFYGPLYIPKKGDIIELNKKNIFLYENLILKFEKENPCLKDPNFFDCNKKTQNKYKFLKNYYFMMGDNRINSFDSRYWGLLPEEYITAKPLFIFFSVDWNRYNFNDIFYLKIRLPRIMKFLNKEKNKYYYL